MREADIDWEFLLKSSPLLASFMPIISPGTDWTPPDQGSIQRLTQGSRERSMFSAAAAAAYRRRRWRPIRQIGKWSCQRQWCMWLDRYITYVILSDMHTCVPTLLGSLAAVCYQYLWSRGVQLWASFVQSLFALSIGTPLFMTWLSYTNYLMRLR